jgi:hypothetical protein
MHDPVGSGAGVLKKLVAVSITFPLLDQLGRLSPLASSGSENPRPAGNTAGVT